MKMLLCFVNEYKQIRDREKQKPHGDNKVNITNASATCLSKVKPTNGNRKLLRIKSNIHVFVL